MAVGEDHVDLVAWLAERALIEALACVEEGETGRLGRGAFGGDAARGLWRR